MLNQKIRLITIILIAVVSCLFISCGGTNEADLVLRNGKIVTVDDNNPEGRAMAIKGDKIVAIGSEEEIRVMIGLKTKVIDLDGKLAIPGFIEGHGHFMGIGYAKMNLELMNVKNWEEIVAMVAEAAKNTAPGEWITGRGWHQEKWDSVPEPNVDGYNEPNRKRVLMLLEQH